MSGGNQQKVILAREVDNGEKVIIFDQPTRGLDLGVNHIHKVILKERPKEKVLSWFLLSSRRSLLFLTKLLFYIGEIQGIFEPAELTTEKIGLLMAEISKSGGEGRCKNKGLDHYQFTGYCLRNCK